MTKLNKATRKTNSERVSFLIKNLINLGNQYFVFDTAAIRLNSFTVWGMLENVGVLFDFVLIRLFCRKKKVGIK